VNKRNPKNRKSTVICWLWQFPQHLLALGLIWGTGAIRYRMLGRTQVYHANRGFGISLGEYIIIDIRIHGLLTTKHEYGHTKQSRLFGPLYLILVGIPSGVFHLLTRFGVLKSESYYTRYPENWADRLGQVNRK
jgi:hypothetical protein